MRRYFMGLYSVAGRSRATKPANGARHGAVPGDSVVSPHSRPPARAGSSCWRSSFANLQNREGPSCCGGTAPLIFSCRLFVSLRGVKRFMVMSAQAPPILSKLVRFAALTLLFALLNYMGGALYLRAGYLTTVKPFVGVGLALILIYGRGWLWPVLIAGTLGGIGARLYLSHDLTDILVTPSVASVTLLATYLLCERMIGQIIDFRSWRHLVRFIAIATGVCAAAALAFV